MKVFKINPDGTYYRCIWKETSIDGKPFIKFPLRGFKGRAALYFPLQLWRGEANFNLLASKIYTRCGRSKKRLSIHGTALVSISKTKDLHKLLHSLDIEPIEEGNLQSYSLYQKRIQTPINF